MILSEETYFLVSCFKSDQTISLLKKKWPVGAHCCTSVRPRVFVRPGSLYRQVFSMIFRPLLLLFYFLLPYLSLHAGGNEKKNTEKGENNKKNRPVKKQQQMSQTVVNDVVEDSSQGWPHFRLQSLTLITKIILQFNLRKHVVLKEQFEFLH